RRSVTNKRHAVGFRFCGELCSRDRIIGSKMNVDRIITEVKFAILRNAVIPRIAAAVRSMYIAEYPGFFYRFVRPASGVDIVRGLIFAQKIEGGHHKLRAGSP